MSRRAHNRQTLPSLTANLAAALALTAAFTAPAAQAQGTENQTSTTMVSTIP